MSYPTKKDNFERFVTAWNSFDEDTREILAGALYVLGRNNEQVKQSHHLTKFAMNDERLKLLNRLVDYTEKN